MKTIVTLWICVFYIYYISYYNTFNFLSVDLLIINAFDQPHLVRLLIFQLKDFCALNFLQR